MSSISSAIEHTLYSDIESGNNSFLDDRFLLKGMF